MKNPPNRLFVQGLRIIALIVVLGVLAYSSAQQHPVKAAVTISVDVTNNANWSGGFSDSEQYSGGSSSHAPFRVSITNNSGNAVTITQIDDDVHGSNSQLITTYSGNTPTCASQIGANVADGATLVCYFDGKPVNGGGGSQINTTTVTADDGVITDTDADTSTVTFASNTAPTGTAAKDNDADGDNNFADENEGVETNVVPFRVRFTNPTGISYWIDKIEDDVHGADDALTVNVSGWNPQCADLINDLVGSGDSFTCYFEGTLGTLPELNTVTITLRSFESGVQAQFTDTSNVIVAPPTATAPTPTRTNTPDPNKSATPTITNTGAGGGSTNTASATITLTPTVTLTPTLLGPFQTLTAFSAADTLTAQVTPGFNFSTSTATATATEDDDGFQSGDLLPTFTATAGDEDAAQPDDLTATAEAGGGDGGGLSPLVILLILCVPILLIIGGAVYFLNRRN